MSGCVRHRGRMARAGSPGRISMMGGVGEINGSSCVMCTNSGQVVTITSAVRMLSIR